MILQLQSNNPKLSYIIHKNPNSGPLINKLRMGMLTSFYENDETYHAVFQDSVNEVSYGNRTFNYLDTSRTSSPAIILGMMTTLFKSTINNIQEFDNSGFNHTLTIPFMYIKNIRTVERVIKYYPEISVDITNMIQSSDLDIIRGGNKYFRIVISHAGTLHKLLNFVSLLTLFITVRSNDYINKTDDSITKYINIINRLNAPFYVRSIFSQYMLTSMKRFDKFKNDINSGDMELGFGMTHSQRFQAISSELSFDKPILEIGHGDGHYTIPYSKRTRKLFAVDINPYLQEKLRYVLERKQIKNVDILPHINEFTYDYGVDVILTEVVEHMELKETNELITKVLTDVKYDKFIITTPNKDFNTNYLLEDNEFRHDDHKWEMNKAEFIDYINELLKPYTVSVKYIDIGDKVGFNHTSIGCVITADVKPVIEDIPNKSVHKQDVTTGSRNDKKNRLKERNNFQVSNMINNGVRYISGTMSPASSDKELMTLESLDNGIEHYLKKGVTKLTIQPKYMGSRCQFYIHKDSNKNIAVSRKGYVIKNEYVDGLETYLKSYTDNDMVQGLFKRHDVDMIIFDGELLPWIAMSGGYFNENFKAYEIGNQIELDFLNSINYNSIMESYLTEYYSNETMVIDKKNLDKTEFINKYGFATYSKYKMVDHIKLIHDDVYKWLEIYKKQVTHFSKNTELTYKPFNILGLYKNGVYVDHRLTNSQCFDIVNDDTSITVDIHDHTDIKIIMDWYNELIKDNTVEGCVIKPNYIELPNEVAPYIKVRNANYLTMVYGYDYKINNYEELVNKKWTGKKVGLSISEYKHGMDMLKTEIGGEDYLQHVNKILKLMVREEELDTRL